MFTRLFTALPVILPRNLISCSAVSHSVPVLVTTTTTNLPPPSSLLFLAQPFTSTFDFRLSTPLPPLHLRLVLEDIIATAAKSSSRIYTPRKRSTSLSEILHTVLQCLRSSLIDPQTHIQRISL
ncbi:hypothetical protein HD806DRAFT_265131 [Xylariaceae sp. AK1471]|nr:hypothetical protein HD806DRAFT_265131 [Xylariaceae sp. AK1471]